MSEDLDPCRRVEVTRVANGACRDTSDVAATEEPLDIRLHGRSFAVIMRTPGRDRELAAGFLLSERIIASSDDLGAVEHCRHPDQRRAHHVVDVFLTGGRAAQVDAVLDRRRQLIANSSCGVCGRSTIDELCAAIAPIDDPVLVDAAILRELPSRLRAVQDTFDVTGGLHGAALFDRTGTMLASAEDVGRHNAVDKVIGSRLLAEPAPAKPAAVLMVSGRVSFEIVQKAWIARIPILCAVSAPTTLAIDLAREARVTLVGFLRDAHFNIYSEPSRISTEDGSPLPTPAPGAD